MNRLKPYSIILLLTSTIFLLHMTKNVDSMLNNYNFAVDNIYLDNAIAYHSTYPVFAKRPFTTVIINAIHSCFHLERGYCFIITNFFFLFINGMLLYELSLLLLNNSRKGLINVTVFFLCFSNLFAFFVPIYSYDEPVQFCFVFLSLIFFLKKKWAPFVIAFSFALVARETSIFLLPGLLIILLFENQNVAPNKIFIIESWRKIFLLLIPVAIYAVYNHFIMEYKGIIEVSQKILSERFHHFELNFQNMDYTLETIFSFLLISMVPLYLLYNVKKTIALKYKRYVIAFLLTLFINTTGVLFTAKARETRTFIIPILLIIPIFGDLFANEIKLLFSFKIYREVFAKWYYVLLFLIANICNYIISFRIYKKTSGAAPGGDYFNEYLFIMLLILITHFTLKRHQIDFPTGFFRTGWSYFRQPVIRSALVFAFLLAVFVPVACFRLVDGDEGYLLMAAKLISQGHVPYRDFFLHQPPGTPALLALFLGPFGSVTWIGARIISATAAAFTGLLVSIALRKQNAKPRWEWASALLFASTSLSFGWLPIAKTFAFATAFLTLAYVLSLPTAPESERRSTLRAILVGASLAGAVLTRVYTVLLVPIVLITLFRSRRQHRDILYAIGGMALVGIPMAALATISHLDATWFDIVSMHLHRSPMPILENLKQKKEILLRLFGLRAVDRGLGLQFALLIAAVTYWLFHRRSSRKFPASAWLLLSIFVFSLLPRPTLVQYFCLGTPFLVELAVLAIRDTLPALRRWRIGVIAICGLYLCLGIYEMIRYTSSGDKLIGINRRALAPKWRIANINRVARSIDTLATAGPIYVSWPGYLVESHASCWPGAENHFGLEAAEQIHNPAERRKLHLLSQADIDALARDSGPCYWVVGNWVRIAWQEQLLRENGWVRVTSPPTVAIWRSNNGYWYIKGQRMHPWGTNGDVPIPGDYNGDGKMDMAVWQLADGKWYVKGQGIYKWGTNGDIQVPGDYNGDGKTDIAVWRSTDSKWYLRGLGTYQWGTNGDIPIPGDYNGDGKTDIAVWRPTDGKWYLRGLGTYQWGTNGDVPVPGDYNGDGKTDIAVWRPSNGNWYIQGQGIYQWGTKGDVPIPGDYNGDGHTDIAVWRPSNGNWYVQGQGIFQWGTNGDEPIPGDYNGDGHTDIAVWRPSNSNWYVQGQGIYQCGTNGDIQLE